MYINANNNNKDTKSTKHRKTKTQRTITVSVWYVDVCDMKR